MRSTRPDADEREQQALGYELAQDGALRRALAAGNFSRLRVLNTSEPFRGRTITAAGAAAWR
jgi:hypothetical protein